MATGDLLKATKAKVGGAIAAVAGLLLPGVTYLLTVDADGITAGEWRRAALLAIAAAAGLGASVGGAVYAVENKAKADSRDYGDPYDDHPYDDDPPLAAA
jgi:hypothetical protein